ncbi:tetrahydromethanopterin S-methyltransferase subunit F [Actinoplanes octamycinicus]|uniref:Tetrahydromethanopterin S-methyltransferase subunit F n=1 Tax=Actinoplanes octamycinicus TaxID=135948 RepID=A0A7W7H429_9ACTN|nr:hypothetical protein [Actinoplanes octamycinicus]MBB4743620.1 tetrahydromethanopterin S-methyltransferase subunit F [Actinoplanes octamycinicus]GIE61045.1 hypothetical protein Aoc01nite_64470 [Actinoplanes octamycinicus]
MWRFGRMVLVALWLFAAVTAWWSAPRHADSEHARVDLTSGYVTAYEWGQRWTDVAPDRWFASPDVAPPTTEPAPIFAWRTPDGRVHWTENDGTFGVGGLEYKQADVMVLSTLINGIGLLFTVVFLVVLLTARPPLTGTRWYWFWLFALVPFGLGVLYWTFREVPWTQPRTLPEPHPEGAEHRRRGLRGLITGIVVSVVASALLLALTHLLGERWVPDLLNP